MSVTALVLSLLSLAWQAWTWWHDRRPRPYIVRVSRERTIDSHKRLTELKVMCHIGNRGRSDLIVDNVLASRPSDPVWRNKGRRGDWDRTRTIAPGDSMKVVIAAWRQEDEQDGPPATDPVAILLVLANGRLYRRTIDAARPPLNAKRLWRLPRSLAWRHLGKAPKFARRMPPPD